MNDSSPPHTFAAHTDIKGRTILGTKENNDQVGGKGDRK